jgi:uncharacterized protein with PIN domain
MQVNDARLLNGVVERKEKVEIALVKLQSLKSQISELRIQCEALKKRQSERQKELTCSECGKSIERGQEVVLKGSFGKLERYYHKSCFKTIWLSQKWIFDYAQPGFLRRIGTDR